MNPKLCRLAVSGGPPARAGSTSAKYRLYQRSSDARAAFYSSPRIMAICPADALSMWLGEGDLPADVVGAMLRPYPADAMTARPASSRLNSAKYDAPNVLTDDDPVQQGLGL